MQEGRDRVLSPVAEVCRNRTDRPAQGKTTGFEVQGGHQTTFTSALIIRQLVVAVQQPQAARRGKFGGYISIRAVQDSRPGCTYLPDPSAAQRSPGARLAGSLPASRNKSWIVDHLDNVTVCVVPLYVCSRMRCIPGSTCGQLNAGGRRFRNFHPLQEILKARVGSERIPPREGRNRYQH